MTVTTTDGERRETFEAYISLTYCSSMFAPYTVLLFTISVD